MPPKSAKAKSPKQGHEQNGPSEEERKKESSKAAQAALAAQKKATELIQAAAGAGDPKERQKLLNEALQKEIEAESFGKTAKYISSGTFQGLAAGTGIGVGTGAGLGTLTGTLVGGVSSLVTGGLGAAVGTGVGALHGPFFKLGDVAGNAISKITGTIPGWEATEEQKKTLEKMLGQVNEQDFPNSEELQAMSGGGAKVAAAGSQAAGKGQQKDSKEQKSTWGDYLPSTDSLPSMLQSDTKEQDDKATAQRRPRGVKKQGEKGTGDDRRPQEKGPARSAVGDGNGANKSSNETAARQPEAPKRKPPKLRRPEGTKSNADSDADTIKTPASRAQAGEGRSASVASAHTTKKPRKLQVRS